jgi:hypothetical protein
MNIDGQSLTTQHPELLPVHIEARRWYQRTYGNTYHSVRIFQGSRQIAYIPFEYGYGDQWLQTACDWLAENGYPELALQHENGVRYNQNTRYLREVLGGTYSIIDVDRKKDL